MRGKNNNNNKGMEERERIDKINSQYNILIQEIQLLLEKKKKRVLELLLEHEQQRFGAYNLYILVIATLEML